ncbi:anti-sigma factor [Candidatus Uabimicrobium sp. HlEnr_7]|uniref:anti-sigma factor family protein n=1 Tax=Candidatus Uabimicrobium helgolandensis TaxID=3095367 RepID=UPI003557C23F
MKCNQAKNYMSSKLDSELSRKKSRLLDLHLKSCENCASRWKDLQKQEALFSEISFGDPGEKYWKNYSNEFVFKKRFPIYRYVTAAALLLTILGMYFLNIFYQDDYKIYDLALANDQQAQRVILLKEKELGTVDKRYFLRDERFLKVEKFVLKLLTLRKMSDSFNNLEQLYARGREKHLSLYHLWQTDKKRSLPIVVKALDHDNFYLLALSLIKESERDAYRYFATLNKAVMWRVLGDLRGYYSLMMLKRSALSGNKEAIRALGKRSSIKAARVLFTCMNRYQIRGDAVRALHCLRPFSIDLIHEKIRQDDPVGIELSTQIFDDRTAGVLLEMTARTRNFSKIVNSLSKFKSAQNVDFFMNLVPYKKYRSLALSVLATTKDSPRVNRFMIRGLQHGHLHNEFLKAIGNNVSPEMIEPIVNVAYKKGLSLIATKALLHMPKKKIIPYLVVMLRSSRLRKSASVILEKLTNEDFGTNEYLWINWLKRSEI